MANETDAAKKQITQKEQKKIQNVFRGTDVQAAKALIDSGFDPNTVLTVKYGNTYDADNPYTVYDIALDVQVWYLEFIGETNKLKEQQGSLEIVKLLTPLVKSAYPLEGGSSYLYRALPRSLGRLDLGSCNKYKKPGMFDVLLDAMIETDYHFAGDKDFFWKIGVVSLETAQKILAITGFDDGASVFSAVENKNFALTDYLLNNGVSPNKPFKFSTGGVITALQEAASCKNTELVKRLLEAGAVETVKNI